MLVSIPRCVVFCCLENHLSKSLYLQGSDINEQVFIILSALH